MTTGKRGERTKFDFRCAICSSAIGQANCLICARSRQFNRGKFLSDLNQLPWANVDLYSDPNEMWHVWKEMFLGFVDKHAPLKSKRIRKKRSPWITRELLSKIRKRDFLKKKAISSNNPAIWDQFRCARNQANNAIKLAKKLYVSDNLEANKGNLRKTWNVINELTSRNSGKSTNILEIKVDDKIASNPLDIAETINDHFTNVAQVLAQDIPVVDVNPESRLRGSFFTRNVNALKRSSPDCAIQTTLCSQPFANSLNPKCPTIHTPKWLIKEKPQSELCCPSKTRNQQT